MEASEKNIIQLIRELEALKQHESYPGGFNIFEAAGMVRQETRHSHFLGFLLDPKKPHGLGARFIKAIVLKVASINARNAISQLSILLNDYDDLIVKPEWTTSESKLRIDLVAWSKNCESVFVIENKVDASAGKTQLADYEEMVSKCGRFDGYKKTYIFLTKNGDEPDSEHWLQLSYEDIISIILEMLGDNEGSVDAELKTMVRHYIELLRRHIVGDENLKNECSRILAKYRDVMDFVYEHGEQLGTGTEFKSAAEKFGSLYAPAIKELTKKPTQYAFVPSQILDKTRDCTGTPYWGQMRPIVMWFYLRGDNSLGLILEVGPIVDPSVDRNGLVQALQKLFGRTRVITATYSRVWSEYKRLEDEPAEAEITSSMTALWEGFRDKHLQSVIKVIEQAFATTTKANALQ